MSLIQQILGQQVVILTIGLALLMLFAAIVLAMIPRMKAARVRRAKVRAQRMAEAVARAASGDLDDMEEEELAARATARARLSGEVLPENEKPAKGGKVAPPVVKQVAALPPAPGTKAPPPAGAPGAKPPLSAGQPPAAAAAKPEVKEETSPEMQDLLSAVFSDEESAERQAKLMKGMEKVEIDHLVTLCNTVTRQVRGENPTNVVKIKENQLQ